VVFGTVAQMLQRLLGIVLLPVAFLVTTPYALVEPKTFIHNVAGAYGSRIYLIQVRPPATI
jgi:hypothetical protein